MTRTLRWIALVGALAGCAYYNGLYNANQLAKEARKAESKGRTGEAKSYWAQAAVKAETVTARYPTSKYRDDALLLQGVALAHTDLCLQAIAPLTLAVDSSPDPVLRQKAQLQLGECYLETNSPDSARQALTPLVASKNATIRSEALLARGRAGLALGNPTAALEDLNRTKLPAAAFPRALALLHLRLVDSAAAVLRARVAGPFDEAAWASLLDSLAAANPDAASAIAATLAQRSNLSSGERARLRLDDGKRRVARGELAKAATDFEAATNLAPDSLEGHDAKAYLAIVHLRRATAADSVDALQKELTEAKNQISADIGAVVDPALSALGRIRRAMADSSPDATLRLFRTTEVMRDSLHAPKLAGNLFLWLARERPTSLLAPKALLAAAALRPAIAESVATVLNAKYPASVYTLALHGEGAARYAAVEDSLAHALRGGKTLPSDAREVSPRRAREEHPTRAILHDTTLNR
ncbi:MAG TPA: hypothetical protein VJ992_11615 [Gemmatimonadales bacterium]|nr:hypothetical protein [Gemmatimonadales bacterium]